MANGKKRKSAGKKAGGNTATGNVLDTEIVEELEKRFLSYALSTIVSRAIPDVRDGLKPVHRRVLYAMHKLRLDPASRFRKSAAVVGDVIGKYHPHGDQAVYDTMVRLAQDFSLRYPLVDGQGNFGNIDGDSAAAMRYTESKLTPLALELLSELKKETVDFVPTYDQLLFEPAVLPARFPNLLVNGSAGIAVGLATNIPPHNMTEVITALIALLENKNLETSDLLKFIKGPDFPTGAEMVITKKELGDIYDSGRGSIKVRGIWNVEESAGRARKFNLVITAIPYGVNKTRLIEKIADLIINGKIPDIIDIRDESTELIRIVLEPKTAAVDPGMVMTYIFRHSELAISYPVNLTALSSDGTPLRMSLLHILKSFLAFRLEVTEKRLRYDLKILEERLHILTALALIYVDLDEAISIIRKSKNRDEARGKLIKHFKIDETQANAILDLRLAALVGMEISKIMLEKAEKEAEKEQIEKVLGSEKRIKSVVKKELTDILRLHGDRRKTKIVTSEKDLPEYNPESFIEHEQTNLIVSRSGWVRRMKNVANPESLRFKESDSRLALLPMNTRDLVAFFTSAGKVYIMRAFDIIQSSGFGEPVQSFFRFADGERLVSVLGLTQGGSEAKSKGEKNKQGAMFDQLKKSDLEKVHGSVIMQGSGTELLVAFENGNGFRLSADGLAITNKNGRKIANVKGDDAILAVSPIPEKAAFIFAMSNSGKGLLFDLAELPVLTGPGGGVRLIKLKNDEHILGVKTLSPKDSIMLTYLSGKDDVIKVSKLEKGNRATSGRKISAARKKLVGMIVS